MADHPVQLQEVPVARGRPRPGWLLVRERAAQLELLAVPTSRQAAGAREKRRVGWSRRIRIAWSVPAVPRLGLEQVLTWHPSHVLREYAEDFIGIQGDALPAGADGAGLRRAGEGGAADRSLQRMTEILQRLVGEDISIRNMRAILEAMVEWRQKEKDVVQLTEYIRSSLQRHICCAVLQRQQYPSRLICWTRRWRSRSAVASARPAPAATWPSTRR